MLFTVTYPVDSSFIFPLSLFSDPTLCMNVRDISLPDSGEEWDAARGAAHLWLSFVPETERGNKQGAETREGSFSSSGSQKKGCIGTQAVDPLR